MLITNHFVYLNFPRTGSNFCRRVIQELYKNRSSENPISQLFKYGTLRSTCMEYLMFNPYSGIEDQHGTFCNIPNDQSQKSVLSVVRNPIKRFESIHHLKWWHYPNPNFDMEVVSKKYKNFPDITIEEYVNLIESIKKSEIKQRGFDENINVGSQTIEFINMFFKKPEEVFKKLSESYIKNKDYLNDIGDIKFIQQENLNEGLASFLKQHKFTKKEISFVKNHKRINATDKKVIETKEPILTQQTIDYIKNTEWMLFEILNELGFKYE